MTTERELLLPKMRPDQREIALHPAKRKWLAEGRRWGKTVLGGVLCSLVANKGGRTAWVVPSYKNARPLWRFLEEHLPQPTCRFSVSDKIVEFPSGGTIGIYTADNPNSLRGESFHLVVVDEAALVSEETYSDVIEPTVADYDGDIYLVTTPKGRNWFWVGWAAARADGKFSAAFTAPTNANPIPTIRRAYELAKNRLTKRTFAQEWDAQFVEDGGVFSMVDESAVAPVNEPPGKHKGHSIGMGIDWGKHEDYTVVSTYCGTCEQQLDLYRRNGIEYIRQRARIKELRDRWLPTRILAESNSIGDPNIEDLRREGVSVVGFETTAQSKPELIEALILGMEVGKVRILPDETQKNELKAFNVTITPAGNKKYAAPEGMHDDCVIALALSRRAATRVAMPMAIVEADLDDWEAG